jgi:TatD DNase family protein
VLTDTHAHLDFPDFNGELPEILGRARQAGVHRVTTIATDAASSRRALELAALHPSVQATVGIHPCSVWEAGERELEEITRLAADPRVCALGECGLDYHRFPENAPLEEVKVKQARFFQAQLGLAAEQKLNVVVHQRDSWEDCLALLKPYTGRLRAVFHCFGGSPEQARELTSLGHLVSFTGIVTFKNAELARQSAAALGPEDFMFETDCPYLAPVPHRGKRCEPAHTRLVAEAVAKVRNVPLEELAAGTERTAEAFFRFTR